jgi:hypothetical protein
MTDIQRWHIDGKRDIHVPADDGFCVSYADHVAAVAEARREAFGPYLERGYAEGQRDERLRIRNAVEGLPVILIDIRFAPNDKRRYVRAITEEAILAVIDGADQ